MSICAYTETGIERAISVLVVSILLRRLASCFPFSMLHGFVRDAFTKWSLYLLVGVSQ